MQKVFKRTRQENTTKCICIMILVIGILILIVQNITFKLIMSIIIIAILVVYATIVIKSPGNFNYIIEIKENYIIINVGMHSYFVNRKFKILHKTKKYIIIVDENSKLKIKYNEDLLKFLKEVRKLN